MTSRVRRDARRDRWDRWASEIEGGILVVARDPQKLAWCLGEGGSRPFRVVCYRASALRRGRGRPTPST